MALASITTTYMDSEPEDEENIDSHGVDVRYPSHVKVSPPQPVTAPSDKPLKPTLVSYNDDTFAGDTTSGDIFDDDHLDEESSSSESKFHDEIELYPEPTGRCSKELQDRVSYYHKRMEAGTNINDTIQHNKEFRNPSIYEKLVQFVGIEELGSNFPRQIYDPHSWGKESYYEALASVQKEEMDKLMKERKEKTKIQVVSGSAKRTGIGTQGPEDDVKRKSKWDQKGVGVLIGLPVRNPTGFLQKASMMTLGSGSRMPAPTLTTAASGTKASVIPAFGALIKKPKV